MAEADKSGEMLAEPPARQDRADADPFRLAVLFLAALIGFCLTLMVAIFGTLHNFRRPRAIRHTACWAVC